jgi:small subunit ribosomal protein S5
VARAGRAAAVAAAWRGGGGATIAAATVAVVTTRGGRGGDDDGGEELIEKLVHINRVSKTVKGGKRFGFAALVVVGDGKGRAGFGHGKAREVPEAISKATAAAKKAMIRVPLRDGRTLHHDGNGHFGAGKVTVRSAPSGTGIIAGGPMRAVFESLGVADVVTKSVGTSNPYNMIRATFEALKEQTSPRSVAQRRGKKVADLLGRGGASAPKPKRPPKRSRSKRDGQDQDHPDRIADPPRQDPAGDAGRPRPQQDAPHGRVKRHPEVSARCARCSIC